MCSEVSPPVLLLNDVPAGDQEARTSRRKEEQAGTRRRDKQEQRLGKKRLIVNMTRRERERERERERKREREVIIIIIIITIIITTIRTKLIKKTKILNT